MDENNSMLAIDDAEIDAAWNDEAPADPPETPVQAEEAPAQENTQDAGGEQENEEAPEQAQEAPADPPELFTVKNRDETRQVTREELVTMAQKGWDYDHVRAERDQLRQYQDEANPALELVRAYAQRNNMSVEDYVDYCRREELMAQGVNEQTAAAQVAMEKQQAVLRMQQEQLAQQQAQRDAAAVQEKQKAEQRKQDMAAFLSAYPGVKGDEIPREVWEKVAGGVSLVQAYTMHRNQQLEAEIAAMKQNEKNQQTTTGSLAASNEGESRSEIDKWWYEDD